MTVPWHQNRLLAFDCETTSPEPREARIVSATVALVGGGLETEAFDVVVDPGVEVPEEAAGIHGLTTEIVREKGFPPAAALLGVVASLAAGVSAGYALVVFNATYDLTVLRSECARHGVEGLDWDRLLVVDPKVIDHHIDRYRAGGRKLAEVCVVYNATLDGAHDAQSDAIAAARLAWRMGTSGRIVRRSPRSAQEGAEVLALHQEWGRVKDDLPALHAAQRAWAWDQRAQLERYFHEGNPKKDVPPQPDRRVEKEWPILPVEAPIHNPAVTAEKEAV